MSKRLWIFSVVVLLLTQLQCSAQFFVPKLGTSVAWMKMSQDQNPEVTPVFGVVAGFGFEFEMDDEISILPELLIIQKGGQYEENRESDKLHIKTKLTYLQLPFTVKTKFGAQGKIYGYFGGSISLAVGGKLTRTYTEYNGDGSLHSVTTTHHGIQFRAHASGGEYLYEGNFDFNGHIGLGFHIMKNIVLDIRYGLGIFQVDEETDSYNRTAELALSLPLTIKRGN